MSVTDGERALRRFWLIAVTAGAFAFLATAIPGAFSATDSPHRGAEFFLLPGIGVAYLIGTFLTRSQFVQAAALGTFVIYGAAAYLALRALARRFRESVRFWRGLGGCCSVLALACVLYFPVFFVKARPHWWLLTSGQVKYAGTDLGFVPIYRSPQGFLLVRLQSAGERWTYLVYPGYRIVAVADENRFLGLTRVLPLPMVFCRSADGAAGVPLFKVDDGITYPTPEFKGNSVSFLSIRRKMITVSW